MCEPVPWTVCSRTCTGSLAGHSMGAAWSRWDRRVSGLVPEATTDGSEAHGEWSCLRDWSSNVLDCRSRGSGGIDGASAGHPSRGSFRQPRQAGARWGARPDPKPGLFIDNMPLAWRAGPPAEYSIEGSMVVVPLGLPDPRWMAAGRRHGGVRSMAGENVLGLRWVPNNGAALDPGLHRGPCGAGLGGPRPTAPSSPNQAVRKRPGGGRDVR